MQRIFYRPKSPRLRLGPAIDFGRPQTGTVQPLLGVGRAAADGRLALWEGGTTETFCCPSTCILNAGTGPEFEGTSEPGTMQHWFVRRQMLAQQMVHGGPSSNTNTKPSVAQLTQQLHGGQVTNKCPGATFTLITRPSPPCRLSCSPVSDPNANAMQFRRP